METFRADEINIEDLFSNKLTYEIPNYQRPYSWGKDQIEKFCDDIMLAFENDEEYLLSSIILVEVEKGRLYEVIDWQQRLTTISILLSVLSHFISDENKDDASTRIFKKSSEARVQRVTTDKSKIHIFDRVLKDFDYEIIKNELNKKENKKNNYYLNAIYLYDFFNALTENDFDFNAFYEFFMERVYLIGVYTINQSKAMRLFEVLNARWLPLKNSDLIKNFVIEKIYEKFNEEEDLRDAKNEEENFSSRWKEIDSKMSSLNESIEDLFTYYIYHKLGENPKKDLFEEFKLVYKKNFWDNISELIKEIYNFYDLYISLYEDKSNIAVYRKIHSMKHLKEGRFWKTILLSYLTNKNNSKDDNYKKLVNEIFRFYYLNWFARETVNPYKQLSFNIIKSINKWSFALPKDKYNEYIWQEFNVDKLRSIFDIYLEDRSVLQKVDKEFNEDVYNEKWIKPLLLLIEYHLKEKESDRVYQVSDKQITIEHIYPQNAIDIDEDIKSSLNSLWNLTLLYQGKNASFSNSNFEDKKTKFKEKNLTEFQLTTELFNKYDSWNLANLTKRENQLFSYINEILDIELINREQKLLNELDKVEINI